jgi:cytochrome c oxidase cbb3-type subunit 2
MEQAAKGNFDGNPDKLTEMDAMVAYLQVLGTMVDFNQYDESYFVKFR